MKKISKSVLEKIKREKISPHKKIFFVIKNFFIFCGGLLFLIFGIFPSAIIFFAFENIEIFSFVMHGPKIFFKIIFVGLPIFWIFLWIFLGFLATNFFRKTKQLYKISTTIFLLFIFLGQIVGGFFFKNSEFVDHFEEKTSHRMYMKSVRDKRDRVWHRPDDGFLIGRVKKIKPDLILRSPDKKEWEIIFDEDVVFKKNINKGEILRIVGEKKDEKIFHVKKLLRPRNRRKKEGRNFFRDKSIRDDDRGEF